MLIVGQQSACITFKNVFFPVGLDKKATKEENCEGYSYVPSDGRVPGGLVSLNYRLTMEWNVTKIKETES